MVVHRLSYFLVSFLRTQKRLFPSLFHSAWVWSHGPASTKHCILSFQLCGHDCCLHEERHGCKCLIVTLRNKCVMTYLYLDSNIKPAGCRWCILGSSTLVFVWEEVPACGSEFFSLYYINNLLRMYKWIFFIILSLWQVYCICIQEKTLPKKKGVM